jgi:L-ribulose-5-phosphate 3-epimerase
VFEGRTSVKTEKPLIACRLGSYGDFVDEAWAHLPTIGIRHIEILFPEKGERAELNRKLDDHGLQVSSMHCPCDIKKEGIVDELKPQFDFFQEWGTKICFTSVHAGETPREIVWDRLREIGDAAAARGITVAMETHPDLVENAKNSLDTMNAVSHSNIRVNFDTANIHYFNEGVTALDELEQSAEFVASIHLKDTTGGFHVHDFPTLGEGVVDYPGVFALMAKRGFTGPFTMELEGRAGLERGKDAQLEHVADSAAYLKSIGVL